MNTPLSLGTTCFYAKEGRVIAAQLGDFKDLVSKVMRDWRIQDKHYLTFCESTQMFFVCKWEGDERWICGYREKALAEKSLQMLHAKEILQNAYGHLHLSYDGAARDAQQQLRQMAQSGLHLRIA